jgi:hypothetical protein
MINNQNVIKYFELMKSKGFIAEYWQYVGYIIQQDHIKLFYNHKSGKMSSYRFLKEKVLEELRDFGINKLFE